MCPYFFEPDLGQANSERDTQMEQRTIGESHSLSSASHEKEMVGCCGTKELSAHLGGCPGGFS